MATEANKRAVERIYLEANDQLRYDLLPELLAEDLVIHSPAPLPAQGREGFAALLAFFRAAFLEQRTAIHALVADGDLVAARHTHHVTHGGEFLGVPPTGKSFAVDGIELFRFADGKVVEFWHNDDMLGLFQHLGLVPGAQA